MNRANTALSDGLGCCSPGLINRCSSSTLHRLLPASATNTWSEASTPCSRTPPRTLLHALVVLLTMVTESPAPRSFLPWRCNLLLHWPVSYKRISTSHKSPTHRNNFFLLIFTDTSKSKEKDAGEDIEPNDALHRSFSFSCAPSPWSIAVC